MDWKEVAKMYDNIENGAVPTNKVLADLFLQTSLIISMLTKDNSSHAKPRK